MFKFTADFETHGNNESTHVWCWSLVDIDSCKLYAKGKSIEEFFDVLSKLNSVVYFHNLKFDGEYIIAWLFQNGYTFSRDKEPKTFNTLITDDLKFYSITVYFKKHNKRYIKVTFYDSFKKLPFKVEKIAKDFKLPIKKGSIDYEMPRPIGYEPTTDEWEYVVNDSMIMAMALREQFYHDTYPLTAMTIGSDALKTYKVIIGGNEEFEKLFPPLGIDVWKDLKPSYKGGYCYLLRQSEGLKGCNFDVNSLYPDRMYNCLLPFGYPVPFDGEYKEDKFYPLYILRMRCNFKLRKKHLPTIQLKNNWNFISTEYLESSNNEYPMLTLTNVDLKLFFEHYYVYDIEYICGWKFKGAHDMFKEYIDYWMNIKMNSDGAVKALAKLMLNNLYGKYGTNPIRAQKIPVYQENGIVKYQREDETIDKDVYIPMASFITAYAREKTIRAGQALYDRFIYSDTDSLKLIGYEMPNIEIDKEKLGAWKWEGNFNNSKFLRAKTYMETLILQEKDYNKLLNEGANGLFKDNKGYYQTIVTCAGMNDEIKKQVTYKNFTIDNIYNGKLRPKRVKGGVILEKTTFKIKAQKSK